MAPKTATAGSGVAKPVAKKVPASPAKPAVETTATTTPIVTTEEVAKRAYLIYLQEGCPAGRHLDHWYRAEAELRVS